MESLLVVVKRGISRDIKLQFDHALIQAGVQCKLAFTYPNNLCKVVLVKRSLLIVFFFFNQKLELINDSHSKVKKFFREFWGLVFLVK